MWGLFVTFGSSIDEIDKLVKSKLPEDHPINIKQNKEFKKILANYFKKYKIDKEGEDIEIVLFNRLFNDNEAMDNEYTTIIKSHFKIDKPADL